MQPGATAMPVLQAVMLANHFDAGHDEITLRRLLPRAGDRQGSRAEASGDEAELRLGQIAHECPPGCPGRAEE